MPASHLRPPYKEASPGKWSRFYPGLEALIIGTYKDVNSMNCAFLNGQNSSMANLFGIAVLTLGLGFGPFAVGHAAEPTPDAAMGPVKFFANLSADEQSTTTLSPGTGRADFAVDRATQRISWKVTYNKLTSAATGAHIHGPQRPGTNAGVQVDLAPNGMNVPLEGSAILTDAQLEYLLEGRMYVNIHSVRYPAGELRGQIQRLAPTAPKATQ